MAAVLAGALSADCRTAIRARAGTTQTFSAAAATCKATFQQEAGARRPKGGCSRCARPPAARRLCCTVEHLQTHVSSAIKLHKSHALAPADSSQQQQQLQQPNATDDASARKYLSLLPPFFSRPTRQEQFGPGLWGLTQPLKLEPISSFDIQLRMTAARLPDGSLLLVSPVAPTAELLGQLAGLGGRVSHIVLPSSSPEHWFYGPALSDAFPEATVWAVPGLLEGKGLPLPFFGALVAGMRPRCKQLGGCAGRDPLGAACSHQTVHVAADPFVACWHRAPSLLPQHSLCAFLQAWTRCRQSCRGSWKARC